MKISQFDKVTCRVLQNAVLAAIQSVADAHGVSVAIAGGKYDSNKFDAKFSFTVKDASGKTVDVRGIQVENDFKQYAELFGLKADDLHREFKHAGSTYKIIGCKPNASKRPIVVQDISTEKRYVMDETTVKACLKG